MIERDIENGIIKPLKTTVFQAPELSKRSVIWDLESI
jgi:hypothetical protein